jgi:predicted metalloprotease with PDZ domain
MRRIHALLVTAGLVAAPASVGAHPDQPPPDQTSAPRLALTTEKPRLGVAVMLLTPELRAHFGSKDQRGVLVSRVLLGSAAAKAGIAVGDVIVDVRGNPVDDAGDILNALAAVGNDHKVKVTVLRDRRLRTFDVDLASSMSSVLDLPPMGWLRELLELNVPADSKRA